jgi:hypothetical protein
LASCVLLVSVATRRATASKPVSDIVRSSVYWHGNSSVSAHSGKRRSLLRACRWLLPVAFPVPSSKFTRRRPCFVQHTVWVPDKDYLHYPSEWIKCYLLASCISMLRRYSILCRIRLFAYRSAIQMSCHHNLL